MESSRNSFLLEHNIIFLFVLMVLWSCVVVVNASTFVVDAPFGKIKGARKTDQSTGLSYLSFKGIPYARPPIGELRFAKPQPHPNIADTFDATKDDKIICPHPDTFTMGESTEDCLILNVYVKGSQKPSTPRKVLVFIHGGAFRTMYASMHNPTSFVLSQDVIVVTINYRLGILGFLSTEDEACPGNYGLWDQTLAFKWVRDNIRAFGGDDMDITISGESAGAASVGFQIISPHAKGLFSKAYAHSGTATSSFALYLNAQPDALTVAKSIGCWNKSVDVAVDAKESSTVMDCMRNAPVSAITAFAGYSWTDTQFTPRVDGDFISDFPTKLMLDDEYLESVGFFDRTYLAGTNNNEGQIYHSTFHMIKNAILMNPTMPEETKEVSFKAFKSRMDYAQKMSRIGETAASDKNISNKITSFYNRRFSSDQSVIEISTDLSFVIAPLDVVRAASRRDDCNSYLLYFNYFPNFMKGDTTGTIHAGDLIFWFDFEISTLEKTARVGMQGQMEGEDLDMKHLFSSIIGEFVRTGNPGLALKRDMPCGWPRYDISEARFLNLNLNPWVDSFLEKDKQDFWFSTLPRLMKTPDGDNAAMSDEKDKAGCSSSSPNAGASPLFVAASSFSKLLATVTLSVLFASISYHL